MFVPFIERPLNVFWPVQLFCALCSATFGDRPVSLVGPAVATSLMAVTMLVPEGAPPPAVALVKTDPSANTSPLPVPLILMLPATSSFCVGELVLMPTFSAKKTRPLVTPKTGYSFVCGLPPGGMRQSQRPFESVALLPPRVSSLKNQPLVAVSSSCQPKL